jgi:3-phosphoshikimate 1-carboxyvinyltransferase
MIKDIIPVRSVDATVRVPGSKSITNRALICASLASGESVIHNASESDDTALMRNALNQLGVLVRPIEDGVIVHGTGGRLFAPKLPIPVGNAGTALRFLMSLAALAEGTTVLEGSDRMTERPNEELVQVLHQLGVRVNIEPRLARFSVNGGGMRGGRATLDGARSSQFLTSLLLTAPYAANDVEIEIAGTLASIPYVHLTEEVMKHFGVEVIAADATLYTVKSGQRYHPAEIAIEPDASGASYFLAAAAIAGGRVRVDSLHTSSLQGDVGFVDVLKRMGLKVMEEGGGLECRRDGAFDGIDVDMNTMPDIVPTLAVTALFARTPTRIRNVAHLQYKESDRLSALATELGKLGASVRRLEDGLGIHPVPLHGALLDTYDDHRLAMSFALIGLRVPGVKIEGPNCVKKSFPGFWKEFEQLGARV